MRTVNAVLDGRLASAALFDRSCRVDLAGVPGAWPPFEELGNKRESGPMDLGNFGLLRPARYQSSDLAKDRGPVHY